METGDRLVERRRGFREGESQERSPEIRSREERRAGDGADADRSGQAPIIRMVNLVIKEALRQRASDIHMEPKEQQWLVRIRVDGTNGVVEVLGS